MSSHPLPITLGAQQPLTQLHNLPDWFVKTTDPYTECLSPATVFLCAATAYLNGNVEDWGDFVEDVAEEQLGKYEDGEAIVTLVKELVDECYLSLDAYLSVLIPPEQRVLVDIQVLDDYRFALTWDEGILK